MLTCLQQLYPLCYAHFGSDSNFDKAVASDLSIVEGLANKAYKVASALFPVSHPFFAHFTRERLWYVYRFNPKRPDPTRLFPYVRPVLLGNFGFSNQLIALYGV